jgi:hypothetical protein
MVKDSGHGVVWRVGWATLACQASACVAFVLLRSNARVISVALFWILGVVVGLLGLICASRTDARGAGPAVLAVFLAAAVPAFGLLAAYAANQGE